MNQSTGHRIHYLADEEATVAFAARLPLPDADTRLLVALHGDLGAGKTSFVRGFLRSKGWQGAVKSPTYTLVEPYELAGRQICHFDLYRLGDPDELEFIGIRDYLSAATLSFVEWPEKGAGVLPQADLNVTLTPDGDGRRLAWEAVSPVAQRWVGAWAGEKDAEGPQTTLPINTGQKE